MTSGLIIGAFVVAAVVLQQIWAAANRAHGRRAQAVADDISALGDDLVPASIHPSIDLDRCMSSGSCVIACPEHDVIGMVGGRPQLINPLACVGHGACAAACPLDAITLVFGTAKRGIELPRIDEQFQTNQPGVYVVGELGGMGLIRNAIQQGAEVGQYIAQAGRRGAEATFDAVVVGAGPAGISATLQLMEEGMRVRLLEGDAYGGTITHYPRAKVVMTGTLDIPRFGKVRKRTMRKEDLIELWESIRRDTNLPVTTGAQVTKLEQSADGSWAVHTASEVVQAANVILALGRRGSPRKLGVPGEGLDKVAYRLLEPEVFRGQRVLVVGGGNAAAECALALSDDGGCVSVSLSYRRSEFARLRGQVRERIEAAAAAGSIEALMPTEVVSIAEDSVTLSHSGDAPVTIGNDAVIVQIGGTPPTALLGDFGIETVVKRGEA